ncbi:hypothetical protein N7509_000842 [Penicillium cosmopolitanum]|uniref:Uncharacterized protein n=1 Tax=Penicillium cosmopolitanum TaxID=1131564 RepID=A0A9X0BEJ8_9EURO|nr:uncharacterized protein N7509_000842 [Penicillium cosmopolitanum]KAJ5414215.1 hypothetical protein N7509_000842 [Penicillium cosmopolitanum]
MGEPSYSSTESEPKSTEESSVSSSTLSSSTSSPSCTITETASSCTLITSYGVDADDSTTSTLTTTSCTPVSGCTVTGTTETGLTTSTATAGCYRFPDDSTAELKRDVHEDNTGFLGFSLARGREKGFSEFGGCNLGIGDDQMFYPTHPGPGKIVDFMKERNTPLKGLYIVPEQDCGVAPKVSLLSNFDTLTSQAYYDQDKKKYAAMGESKSPFVQTEHVLPAFLDYQFSEDLIS